MAQYSLTANIPDAKVETLARGCGWDEQSENTQPQQIRAAVLKFLKQKYKQQIDQDGEAAKAAVVSAADDSDITLA